MLKMFKIVRKKRFITISVFGYEKSSYHKNTFERHVDILLLKHEDKSHYVLIKDFNRFTEN